MADRRQRVLHGLKLDGLGLEIGAGYRPLVAGDPALRVKTLDHASQEELSAHYAAQGLDPSNIPKVDYVWRGEDYVDLVSGARFDWIVASHVIEHTPDLIRFLGQCGKILKVGGVLSLVIPDKRFSFDIYRPTTGLARIIDAHLHGDTRPTPGAVAEHEMNASFLNGALTWNEATRGVPLPIHTVAAVRSMMDRAAAGAYMDMHVWVFTPSSFRLALLDLASLDYIQLRERSFQPSSDGEFFIQLTNEPPWAELDRLSLLRKALGEQSVILDQSDNAELVK